MAYEQRELTGTLFRNDRKEQPNQPDYRGDCLIDGVTYRISSWIKQGQNGKFMSLAFTVKDGAAATPSSKSRSEDMGGDIVPF
jgi:hypothetical protein